MTQKFLRSWLSVLLLILLALPAKADVPIDSAHFPDAAFRDAVRVWDTGYRGPTGNWIGVNDGVLHPDEIARATDITVFSPASSLKGIEYFHALKKLVSRNGNLTSVNLSNNPGIGMLNLDYNKFTSINVSSLSGLYHFHCIGNKLTSLNVSSNAALQELMCSNNPLGKLNVSNNSALNVLVCDFNELEKLDVSHNPALTELHCIGNELTALDVTQNPALTALYCDNNHITELDLSRNKALTEVHCYGQTAKGLIVKATDKGYEVDIKDYVKNLENLDVYSFQANHRNEPFVSYEDGVVTFSELPENVTYFYRTHSPNNALMDVTIERSLIIEAIGGGGPNHGQEIICDIDANSYKNSKGEAIDEAYISQLQYSDYGKFGFTADGNSRIILRVRTDAPGSVTFSMPGNNLGIGIEALTNRADLNSGGSVAAYEIEDGVYQASAVLIAPETFPSGKNFPSDSFAVVVTFYGNDGSVKTGMIYLKIEAAPVILIPGFSGSLTRSAVFSGLTANNFNKSHIYEYKYSQFKYFDETCAGLDKLLTNIFRSYAQYGLVCTKADIAAYGAGGLIAEKFLSDMQKDANSYTYNQPAVRRLVTIATPHYGTPYADIWLNSDLFLNILEGTTYGPIKLLLKTLISANREFVLKDDRLFPELATTAAHDYVFPKGVPVFCIYGDVSDELLTELVAELADRILQMKTDGKLMFNFKDIPGTAVAYALKYSPILLEKYAPRIASKLLQSLALKAVPFIGLVSLGKDIKDLLSLSIMLTSGLMFNSQKHDMYVSASSATGNFTASNVGFEGMEHEHFQIYKQPDIGNRTAALLKGSASVFSTPSRQAPPLNNYNKYKYSANKAEETFKFIEALKLSVEPAAFTLAEGRTQTVKVNVTANHETKYDIYCFIDDGTDGKIFIIPSSDNTGRNFYAEVNFDYNDLGNRNMFCFSCNPSDDTGESIYVSNVAQITAVADMTSIDAVSLDFNYGAELRAYVSADAPAGLYAIDKDGNYYDISSPLAGTEWIVEDPSIAYIDENGRVVGLKEGSTNLTAVYNGVSASVTVEVGEAYDTEAYQDEDNNNEDSENSNNEDNNEKDDEDGKGGDDAKLTTKRSGGGGGCSSADFGMFALLSLSSFAVSARKRF